MEAHKCWPLQILQSVKMKSPDFLTSCLLFICQILLVAWSRWSPWPGSRRHRIWDEPGPIIESCGSITSHKNHGQKVNCWFFLVISSSQHPHPLVRPGHKKRNMPGHLARRQGGNVGMKLCQDQVCVCMLSVLKMLPSGAPHLLGHSPRHRDTVAIHHLRLQAQPGEHWPLIGQSASLSLLIGCPGLAALVWSGPDLSGWSQHCTSYSGWEHRIWEMLSERWVSDYCPVTTLMANIYHLSSDLF